MRARRGFTVLELVVVVAIIMMLVVILFPVFGRARDKARQSTCLSNLKQLSLAYEMYRKYYENEGLDPAILKENVLEQGILPYTKNNRLFNCSSDYRAPSAREKELFGRKLSYGWNQWTLKEAKGRMSVNDAQIPLVFDASLTRTTSPWKLEALPENPYPLALRHAEGMNVAFFDGHARWLSREYVEDGVIGLKPKEEIVWSGDYIERPKTAERAAFPNGTEDVADGVYVFRVEDGKAEQIAGPLK